MFIRSTRVQLLCTLQCSVKGIPLSFTPLTSNSTLPQIMLQSISFYMASEGSVGEIHWHINPGGGLLEHTLQAGLTFSWLYQMLSTGAVAVYNSTNRAQGSLSCHNPINYLAFHFFANLICVKWYLFLKFAHLWFLISVCASLHIFIYLSTFGFPNHILLTHFSVMIVVIVS